MSAKLRSNLSYANVMATIAVFIALGGSSYAAVLRITSRNVPKDALTGADIKNLTGRDVKNNSLTGADVRNLKSGDVADGSLLGKDFAPGQLPKGEKGDTGPVGPTSGTAAGNYEDPPAAPNFVLEESTITMATAGRIYVQGSLRTFTASCNFTSPSTGAGGNCNSIVGLYVDGQPVPHSARSTGGAACASSGSSAACTHNGTDYDWNLFGVSGIVPAGEHKVQLSAKITATLNPQSTGAAPAQTHTGIVGGIALGG